MAYSLKYRFNFLGQNGDQYTIDVEKKDYSGSIISRALGRAPVLKRERNGHVCGSSLEFYPECKIDGEFSEFYTSDPKMFRVSLRIESPDGGESYQGVLFYGFISPEIYAEPDIAPPYDVQVIATDGLGELRRYEFDMTGEQTLKDVLQNLLAKSGYWSTVFRHNNKTLSAGGSYTVPAAKFFDEAKVDVTFLAGKSCYDALSLILDSIHADLFYWSGFWQIIRETDVESGTDINVNTSQYGASYDTTTRPTVFGSARTYDIWPVGQLETEIKPACKRLAIKTDAYYKDAFVNPDIESATGWTLVNASYDSTLDAIKITSQNGMMSQKVTFQTPVMRSMRLSIALRQYMPTGQSPSSAGTVGIQVLKRTSWNGTLVDQCLAKNSQGEYWWDSYNVQTLTFDLPAPSYYETADESTIIDLTLPISWGLGPMGASADYIELKIIRTSSNIPLLVHSASLRMANEIAGYQDIFVIDNGAREEASDVDTIFLPSLTGFYNTPVEFVYNNLHGYNDQLISIFTQVGTDYVKSCALPRLLKKGVLNVPAGTVDLPFVFRDTSGINYLVQTIEWDLYNCEMTVEMLSLPAVSVQVSEQEISELVFQGGTTTSSGSSSGSGGGGGGGGTGVTSIGLSMPSGFTVSNSPITSSGTISVGLDNTRYLPTTTDKSDWDAAGSMKHTHSNKTTLDRITSRDVNFLKSVEYFMLPVAPTLKRFTVQANYESVLAHEYPFFIVRHPLFDMIEMGVTGVEICLMVYRKRNGNGGSDKAHRKGWFLACGAGHAMNAAYTTTVNVVENGSVVVPELFLKDGIARTYCQHDNVSVLPVDYADWIFQVANATAFGFAGSHEATMLKKKIHFGLAVRLLNPEFDGVTDPLHELDPDTNCIQGIPRYLYSAVAPLTAHMYTRTVWGQQKGSIVFDLL